MTPSEWTDPGRVPGSRVFPRAHGACSDTAMENWSAFDKSVFGEDYDDVEVAARPEDAVRGFDARAMQVPDIDPAAPWLPARVVQLAKAGVGSTRTSWGVFSGGTPYYLERTLWKLHRDEKETSRSARDQALHLLRQLPRRRLDAYRDEGRAELDVQAEVLALAANLSPSRKKALIEHLPGDLRPLTTSLEALRRREAPILVALRRYDSPDSDDLTDPALGDEAIILSDICVNEWVVGLGLGSAALTHLCRCADDIGATITGELFPGRGYLDDRETRIPRLARWYARHLFTLEDDTGLPPDQWQMHKQIVRPPRRHLP